MSAQRKHLERVSDRLAATVFTFCKKRMQQRVPSFFASSLLAYVQREHGTDVAPDSPGRILRMLRRNGEIDYTVDRARSRYTLTLVSYNCGRAECRVCA